MGSTGDAGSSQHDDNDDLALEAATDGGHRQSIQSLRLDFDDMTESTGSPAIFKAQRSQIPVLSPPNPAKQVRWSDGSDLGIPSSLPSSPPSMPPNNTPFKRPPKRPASSRKDSKHTSQPTEANSSKSRTKFPERIAFP